MIRSRRNLFKRALATTGAVIASSSVVAQVIKEPLPKDVQTTIIEYFVVSQGNIPQQTFDAFDVTTTTAKQLLDHHEWKLEMARLESERRVAKIMSNPHHHIISPSFPSHTHGSNTLVWNGSASWVSVQDAINEIKPSEVIAYEAKVYTQYDTSSVDQFLADYEALTT